MATRKDDDPGQDERGTFMYYLFYKVILPGVTVAAAANAMGRPRRTFQAVGSPLRTAYQSGSREAAPDTERDGSFAFLPA